MNYSRRELAMVTAPLVTGCASLRPEPKATVVDRVSGASLERYIQGQPTLSDTPVVDAYLATDPTAFDALLREEATNTPLVNSFRQQRQRFEPGRHFWTVLAAATRGQSLQSYRDARIRNGTVELFVEPYGDSVDAATLYYVFALWRLADGVSVPEGVTVEFRPERYTGGDG